MGLFHNLLLSIVHLLLVALDIAGFFLLVKLIYWCWPRPWLLPWEQLGSSLVENLTWPLQMIGAGQGGGIRPQVRWVLGLLLVIILRFILTTTLR